MAESLRTEFFNRALKAGPEAPVLRQQAAELDQEVAAAEAGLVTLKAKRKDVGERLAEAEKGEALVIKLDKMIGSTQGATAPVKNNTPAKPAAMSSNTPAKPAPVSSNASPVFDIIPRDPRLRTIAPVATMLPSPDELPFTGHPTNEILINVQFRPQLTEFDLQRSQERQERNNFATPQLSRIKGPEMDANDFTPAAAKIHRISYNRTPEPRPNMIPEEDTIKVTPRTPKPEFVPLDLNTRPTQLNRWTVTSAKGIPGFEIVVLFDGKWTEISCGICGKNAITENPESTQRFIAGTQGMCAHIRFNHLREEQDKSIVATFKHIKRREVSKEDAELMLAGKEPKVKIVMNDPEKRAKETPNKGMAEKRKKQSPQFRTPQKKRKAGSTDDDDETPTAKS